MGLDFFQQINKLQVYRECKSNYKSGLKLKISLDLLIVEVSISTQSFRLSFQKYSKQTMWSWLTLLWEKCNKFKVTVEFNVSALNLSREHNQWIMEVSK